MSRLGRLTQYLNRSSQVLRDNTSRGKYLANKATRSLISSPYYRLSVIRMAGADEPSRAPLGLWTFNTKEQISQFATGCDGDIGGTSTVHLDLDESSAVASTRAGRRPTGRLRKPQRCCSECQCVNLVTRVMLRVNFRLVRELSCTLFGGDGEMVGGSRGRHGVLVWCVRVAAPTRQHAQDERAYVELA